MKCFFFQINVHKKSHQKMTMKRTGFMYGFKRFLLDRTSSHRFHTYTLASALIHYLNGRFNCNWKQLLEFCWEEYITVTNELKLIFIRYDSFDWWTKQLLPNFNILNSSCINKIKMTSSQLNDEKNTQIVIFPKKIKQATHLVV